MGLMDFFSPEAGQKRRNWLDAQLGGMWEYVPPELRPFVALGNEMNPVTSIERAGSSARAVADPNVKGWDKVAAVGDTASNMANALAPVMLGSSGAVPAANAVEEALMGWSASSPMAYAARDFVTDEFGGVGFGDEVASRGATIMDMLRSGRGADVTDEMLDMGDPVANARLNEWLFNNYDLPMDAASRAARADALGFDRPAFHETGSDFAAFDLGKVRAAASDSELPRGVFTKPTAKSIGLGGDTEAQMPVQIRSGTSAYYESRPGFVRDFSTDDAYASATTRANAFDNAKNRQFERRFEDDRPGRRSNQWTKEQWADYDAAVDEYLARWKAQNAELATRAQREANRVAAERGIDTINIRDDAGSFKRSTETNISLDPANVRSRFARFDPRLSHLRNLSAGIAGLGLMQYGQPQE